MELDGVCLCIYDHPKQGRKAGSAHCISRTVSDEGDDHDYSMMIINDEGDDDN